MNINNNNKKLKKENDKKLKKENEKTNKINKREKFFARNFNYINKNF